MNEALKIMDEIEQHAHSPEIWGKKWQSLRAALEAQAEELARLYDERRHLHELDRTFASQPRELAQKDESYIWLESKHHNRMLENEALRARIARLENAIRDEIADINETLKLPYGICLSLEAVLDEHPRQSVAAIKAEALQEAIEGNANMRYGANSTAVGIRAYLKERAERIKRDAKEGK